MPLVCAGLNDPQAADPQVAVHNTPALLESFVTVTMSVAVVFTSSELGPANPGTKARESGAEMIVRLTLLLCEALLVTVAVIVTVVPMGTTDGAI